MYCDGDERFVKFDVVRAGKSFLGSKHARAYTRDTCYAVAFSLYTLAYMPNVNSSSRPTGSC